jgi:competence ComEA-like helix-hairpin-helix protein
MGDFTRQEKIIISFLTFVLLTGIGVDFYKKQHRRSELKISRFTLRSSRPAFKESLSVNVNEADIGRLSELPGIGPTTAARIVQYRIAHGPFRKADDLLKVSGIGKKKLAQIEKLLSF